MKYEKEKQYCKENHSPFYDALIIPGGTHVNPKLYGQTRRSHCSHPYNNALDALEMKLVGKFVKAKKPVLGICRGSQLINVYFGGTLNQDIGKGHLNWKKHYVNTVAGSDMRELFGKKELVLCWHHQAAKKLGKGLQVTMKAKDGVVEAYQHKSLPVIGVQWHPEKMLNRRYKSGYKFFKYFFGIVAENK